MAFKVCLKHIRSPNLASVAQHWFDQLIKNAAKESKLIDMVAFKGSDHGVHGPQAFCSKFYWRLLATFLIMKDVPQELCFMFDADGLTIEDQRQPPANCSCD